MTYRELLIEVMARAICRNRAARACDWQGHDCCADGCKAPVDALLHDHHEVGHQAKAALAAAERAGFEFRKKENGDG